MSVRRLAAALAACVAVAACATMAPKPLPPTVELERARVTRFLPGDTRMTIVLIVHNPNAYDLVVDALDATVAIEGERLATGALTAAATLAAGGDTRVQIDARTDIAAAARAFDRVARGRRARYDVSGSAVVQGGVRLAFARRGELPIGEFAGTTP